MTRIWNRDWHNIMRIVMQYEHDQIRRVGILSRSVLPKG